MGIYEYDTCSTDIKTGKQFYDCRLCDHSMCKKCHKAAEAAQVEAGPEPDEGEMQEIFDSICEAHIEPVRVGRKLCFRCGFSGSPVGDINSSEQVLETLPSSNSPREDLRASSS